MMANMSYCRFRNTEGDLRDCYENFEEPDDDDEQKARLNIIKMCCDIALDYGYEVKRDIVEE